MYVLVMRGYRQLKPFYRYRQHMGHHHHHHPYKTKMEGPVPMIRIKQRIN